MIKQFVKGRTIVFIDAANILYSQKTLGWRVDYEKLKKYFESECDLTGMHFYSGIVGDNAKQVSFVDKLKVLDYVVKVKEVKMIKLPNGNLQMKGNLDIEIAIDVLGNIENFDTLILMSGDSDFAPLLDTVKSRKKRVIVISTKGHVSKELLDRAKYVNLKKLREAIEMKIPPFGERYDSDEFSKL